MSCFRYLLCIPCWTRCYYTCCKPCCGGNDVSKNASKKGKKKKGSKGSTKSSSYRPLKFDEFDLSLDSDDFSSRGSYVPPVTQKMEQDKTLENARKAAAMASAAINETDMRRASGFNPSYYSSDGQRKTRAERRKEKAALLADGFIAEQTQKKQLAATIQAQQAAAIAQAKAEIAERKKAEASVLAAQQQAALMVQAAAAQQQLLASNALQAQQAQAAALAQASQAQQAQPLPQIPQNDSSSNSGSKPPAGGVPIIPERPRALSKDAPNRILGSARDNAYR